MGILEDSNRDDRTDAQCMERFGRPRFRRADGSYNEMHDHVVATQCTCKGRRMFDLVRCSCGELLHDHRYPGEPTAKESIAELHRQIAVCEAEMIVRGEAF